MNPLFEALQFVVVEGTLLAALFFGFAVLISLVQQHWGGRLTTSFSGVSLERGSIYAAVAGLITPFCSCSTVPVLSGMLRARIRFGICFTFLIASPVINEGVILVMLREYQPVYAITFVLMAGVISVLFGVAADKLGFQGYLRDLAPAGGFGGERVAGSAGTPASLWATRLRFASQVGRNELRAAAPYLAVGILVGALIYGYVPTELLVGIKDQFHPITLIVAMALLGVPFYVNSAMVVPIALALISRGMDIGPVVAFLVSASGTSIPEMILLTKLFRMPLVLAHVVTIVLAAVGLGLGLHWLFGVW
jgi:uncharacterized membrane protein YraQ (UPF0718 family)